MFPLCMSGYVLVLYTYFCFLGLLFSEFFTTLTILVRLGGNVCGDTGPAGNHEGMHNHSFRMHIYIYIYIYTYITNANQDELK